MPDLSGEYPLSGDDAAALLPVSLGGGGHLGLGRQLRELPGLGVQQVLKERE